MCHYPDLGRASDWSCNVGTLLQTIRLKQRCCMTKHYPDLGSDASSVRMEFLCSFLRCCFPGKTVVAFQNVGCFLRLRTLQGPNSNTFCDTCTYCFDFSFQFFNLLVNLLLILHCIQFIMVHLTRAMNSFSTTSYNTFNIVAVC